jgi:hypothetical protein
MASLKDYLVDGKLVLWTTQTIVNEHIFEVSEDQIDELEHRLRTELPVRRVEQLYEILSLEYGDPEVHMVAETNEDFNLYNRHIGGVLFEHFNIFNEESEELGGDEVVQSPEMNDSFKFFRGRR